MPAHTKSCRIQYKQTAVSQFECTFLCRRTTEIMKQAKRGILKHHQFLHFQDLCTITYKGYAGCIKKSVKLPYNNNKLVIGCDITVSLPSSFNKTHSF